MLMGMPCALEGLLAAELLFSLVRRLMPTLLRPLAFVIFEMRWKSSWPEGETVPLPVDSPRAGRTE